MQRSDRPDPIRRRLLAGTAGVAGFGLLGATPSLAAGKATRWDAETDVLVVGTGAAGSAAAIFAHAAGARLLMVEKADCYGGTTAKSQGGYWVSNNHLMRSHGLTDEPRRGATWRACHIPSCTTRRPSISVWRRTTTR